VKSPSYLVRGRTFRLLRACSTARLGAAEDTRSILVLESHRQLGSLPSRLSTVRS